MENLYFKEFQSAIDFFNSTPLQKILKSPFVLPYSMFLPMLCEKLHLAIPAKAKTFWGDQMNVLFPEAVSVAIYRYHFFERELTSFVLKYLQPGMVFFDIGAHFGYFTLLASRLVGSHGQVHAFEPTPSTFEMLQSNVGDNNNIKLNNFAIWSSSKTLSLNDYGLKFAAFNSLYTARLSTEDRSQLNPTSHQVKAISIDSYIEETGVKPDFVKIDAESAEYEILSGMDKTMRQIQPIISLEVGDEDIDEVVLSKELVKYLLNRGYKALDVKQGEIVVHQPKDIYQYGNLLFVPS